MKKKILVVLIVALIISGAVLGYSLIKVSVSEANQLVIENDKYLEIDQLNLEIAQINYDDAILKATISEKYSYNGKITTLYTPFIQETNLKLVGYNNNKSIQTLEKEVLSLSYDYYINENNYLNEKSNYELALENYNVAKNDSLTTPLLLMQLEYQVNTIQISMITKENMFLNTKEQLKALIGEEKIIDLDLIVINSPYEISKDMVLDIALEKNVDLYTKLRAKDAKEIFYNIVKEHYKEDTTTYISALAGYEKAKLDYQKQLDYLNVRIISDLNNLKTKYDYIKLEILNNKIKKLEFEASLEQYENGYISLDTFNKAKTSFDNLQIQLLMKEKSYILALKDFEIYTGYTN